MSKSKRLQLKFEKKVWDRQHSTVIRIELKYKPHQKRYYKYKARIFKKYQKITNAVRAMNGHKIEPIN